MLNRGKNLSAFIISAFSAACLTFGIATPASSQILPEVWGSVGTQDDDLSYAGGVKWSGLAVEVGTGKEGATGGDFLVFFPLPVVSPYVGAGVYSGDDTFAYSGGLHLSAGRCDSFSTKVVKLRGTSVVNIDQNKEELRN